jgi:hypothetical protein
MSTAKIAMSSTPQQAMHRDLAEIALDAAIESQKLLEGTGESKTHLLELSKQLQDSGAMNLGADHTSLQGSPEMVSLLTHAVRSTCEQEISELNSIGEFVSKVIDDINKFSTPEDQEKLTFVREFSLALNTAIQSQKPTYDEPEGAYIHGTTIL